MLKQYWKRIFFSAILLAVIALIPFSGIMAEAADPADLPTTGFEDRNGEGWTTFEEEYAFLDEVAEKSDRMTYTEIGKSIDGRPLHLVKIGFPGPPSDEDIANGNNLLVAGSHHGNEPAGRDMALQLIRNLAFTDDPELIEQLKDITVLVIPTANPDGRARNWRYNAERVDLNRDYLHLSTPETRAIAKIMGQYEPDIVIDAHERPSGATPQMEMAWSRNPNIEQDLFDLSQEMVLDTVMPYVESYGFTTGIYGSDGRWLPENMLGFRHSLDVVTESAGQEPPASRVEMQLRTVEGIMKFYRDHFNQVVETVNVAEERKKQADKFNISADEVLDSVPCGYLIHNTMADKIKNHIEILPLETEQVSEEGIFVTMEQRMMTVIPLLLDPRSEYNLVDGLALNTCENLDQVEPPPAIEYTGPAQYSTDFSEYEVGKIPHDWTPIWKESSWTIKDDPRRLEHNIIGAGNGRRALTMDEVGEVYGDVEISSVVRAKNTGDTMLQIGFHMTGERTETVSTENYYYLDIRKPDANLSPNRVRINKVQNGSYQLLSSAVMPFTAEEDTWYSVVLQREGNMLRAKIWPYGEEEPAAFQVSVSDSSFDHGLVGVTHFDSFAINDYAFFGVGTGGEPAPRPPQNLFDKDLPTTGFEDRDSQDWTTLEEEHDFIKEIAEMSDRVWYEEVGQSVEGRPIYMAYVGDSERTKEEVKDGRTVFIMGTPHGNEPAGREGAFKILRELAFTDDPTMLDVLEKSTVLILPTPNPDGREANTRANAWGIDNNRDNLNLVTPENQTIARILNEYNPDITIDAHERPSGSNPDIEYLWPRNLNVDREMYELNVELIEDYMMPDARADGWTTGLYGSPGGVGREDERILRNMGGLRHGMSVLTESAGTASNEDRVSMQLSSYHSVLRFYQERFAEIVEAVDGAPVRKQEDGKNKADFYLAGADDELDKIETITPPVCGYLLNAEQAKTIERHIELYSLETEQIDDNKVFITMDQPMMTVIPFLVDDRANYNEVAGLPVEDCSDLDSLDPPEAPEMTEPAQHSTDFSKAEVGSVPTGWSTFWRDSNWEIKDGPRRLEHQSIGNQGVRRALTWDEVGVVKGDVEVSAVVRARDTGLSKFQVGFHMSGESGSTDGFYLDVYEYDNADTVRINRVSNGSFSLLSRTDLPFSYQDNEWYQVVIKREGNRMWAKAWPFGEEEPDFQTLATDNSYNEGKIGFIHLTNGVTNDFAFIGVGTGGMEAPRAPEDLFDEKDPEEPEVNKDALQELVDGINAENLNESDYTADSWKAFDTALKAAENVLADDDATQDAVDSAQVVLDEAYKGLEEVTEEPEDPADKSALQAKVTEVKGLEESDYTAASWAALEAALEAAENMLADEDATQGAVDSALSALDEAYKGLEEVTEEPEDPADKSALQAKVAEIKGLEEANYTTASWAALEAALEAAENMLADEDATQGAVDGALSALDEAQKGLEEVTEEPEDPADKSVLQAKVDEVKGLEEMDYTADSWKAFDTALKAAENVLADDDATQDAVDSALATLDETYKDLEEVTEEPADKSALQAKVAKVKNLEEADYTVDSWAALEVALETAENVLADKDASQNEIDNVLAALEEAQKGLKEKIEDPKDPIDVVDKSALQAKVAKIESADLKGSDFTEDSWVAFTTALGVAKAVLTDEKATQDLVNAASENLTAAFADLVEETPGGDKAPVDDGAKNKDRTDNGSDKLDDGSKSDDKLPNTATPYYNWIVIGLLFMMLAGVVWKINRKKQLQ